MSEYICPHCRQPIYDDQELLCLYCGESLNRPVGFMGRLKYFKPRAMLILIVVLVLVSFMILIMG